MKYIVSLLACFLVFISLTTTSFAVENPLSVNNNKFGIHILFPSELEKAASLVNSNNGDWGYVVIPIQAGDKNIEKWQAFMDNAKKLHVIPIIRLATENNYFDTKVWRKPTSQDVLDFANFLNSLSWPTKNRYIIVFNEVNRGDEWGGVPNPSEYARLLQYAVQTFKERSDDFFIISAGLDNAAANSSTSMNEYDFLQKMQQAIPGIFNQIDGLSSHSYPNPGFSQLPTYNGKTGITSFLYEKNLVQSFASKDLPVFITETGWDQNAVGQQNAAQYLSTAFTTVWNTTDVVTVAPFLLQAESGPFTQFSFLDQNGNPNAIYAAFKNLPKIKGLPVLLPSNVLGAQTNILTKHESFSFSRPNDFAKEFESGVKAIVKLILHIQ